VGEEPPPQPVGAWSTEARDALRMTLLRELCDRTPTVRPFARLIRVAHVLIEWNRFVENRLGRARPSLRRYAYDVLLVARLLDAALDRVVLAAVDDVVSALDDELGRVRFSA